MKRQLAALALAFALGVCVAACAALSAAQQGSATALTATQGACITLHANEGMSAAQQACGIEPEKAPAAQVLVTCAAPVVAPPPDPRDATAPGQAAQLVVDAQQLVDGGPADARLQLRGD